MQPSRKARNEERGKTTNGRQRLIDATLDCLAEHGYHRSSVRRIATAAGVTPGLLRYHFQSKENLLVESYRQFKGNALAVYLNEADEAGPEPAKKLAAFTRSILFFNAADRKQMNIWLSFLESVVTDSRISTAQAANYDIFIQNLSHWLTRLYADRGDPLTPDAIRKLAIGINSIIDGLWLECSLNPSRMTPEEALEIGMDLIGARIGVPFGD